MSEYRYDRNIMGQHSSTAIEHVEAGHTWEEWSAYVCDTSDAPEYVDGDSSGICCHTCQVILVDVLADDDAPAADVRKVSTRAEDDGDSFPSPAPKSGKPPMSAGRKAFFVAKDGLGRVTVTMTKADAEAYVAGAERNGGAGYTICQDVTR